METLLGITRSPFTCAKEVSNARKFHSGQAWQGHRVGNPVLEKLDRRGSQVSGLGKLGILYPLPEPSWLP